MLRMKTAFQQLLARHESAVPSAIMRIALVLLLWDRWASDFLLYKADTPLQYVLYSSYMVATPLLLVGLFTQLAAWWTAATMLGVFYGLGVMGGVESYTHHHTYLLTTFAVLIPLIPSGRALSVDRWWAVRKAERTGQPAPPATGDTWAVPLIGLQLTAMYVWAAYDKFNYAFASGQRLHAIFQWYYGSADPIAIPGFSGLMVASAAVTICGELALATFPWIPKLRLPTLLFGVVFHGMLFMSLPVGPFSATVWAMYLAYLPAADVDRWLRRALGAVADDLGATPANAAN